MSTLARPPERASALAEIEARERTAWRAYRDELGELSGREYEEREPASWAQLRAMLDELEAKRRLVIDESRAPGTIALP